MTSHIAAYEYPELFSRAKLLVAKLRAHRTTRSDIVAELESLEPNRREVLRLAINQLLGF